MTDYEVDILVNGRSIRQFYHKGNTFVEGRKGSNFEIRITNTTWGRVEIVPSVDGLSVMDGKPCGIQSDGYLVPANQSIVIPGWRLDTNNVGKFFFKGKEKSYAKQSGYGTENIGVIGFMVFKERIYSYSTGWNPPIDWVPMYPSSTSSSNMIRGMTNCGGGTFTSHTSTSDEEFELGVGFGEQASHGITRVSFTREDEKNPNAIISIYYDSRRGLENRGIKVVGISKKKSNTLPNAFPTYRGCTPPPGWKS